MFLTIFTPTYNRGSLLPRLYASLCIQTKCDFEWLIVDDGSTDNTESVVRAMIDTEQPLFPIRYYKKPNGGKHTAINYGVERAHGDLFFIADSDDVLPNDALRTVWQVWNGIGNKDDFGGVCGLDGIMGEGTIIGSGIPDVPGSSEVTLPDGSGLRYVDGTNMEVRFGIGVTGDMKEVYKTSVLKEFPFPEIDSERFCPEVLVWNRIGTKYRLRYFNRVIYLAEYQNNGITAGITRARMNSPLATMMTYQEMTEYDIPMKWKVRAAINYWRFHCCCRCRDSSDMEMPRMKWYWSLLRPMGCLMHGRDVATVKS